MSSYAFKEWAVICKALAEGRQALILRKGGIAENDGVFQPEHTRFWLYPTYVHQQREGIKPAAQPLLEQAEAERLPPGVLRLTHFAEVVGIYVVHDLASALMVLDLHLWSAETVAKRFAYRQPELYIMPVRVYRAVEAVELPELPSYAGCRSWVELERELPTQGSVPVLDDARFQTLLRTLDDILKPTALA